MTHPAILTRKRRFAVSVCLIFASLGLVVLAFTLSHGPANGEGRKAIIELSWIAEEAAESAYERVALELDGFPYWSPDGTRIIEYPSADSNDSMKLRDARDLSVIASCPGRRMQTWSPDSKYLALWSWNCLVYDAEKGRLVCDGGFKTVYDVAWSPDGKKLAVCSGEMSTLDTVGKRVDLCPASSDHLWMYPVWSPNGKALAARDFGRSSDADLIAVWSADTSELIQTLKEPALGGYSWSPDGKYFAYSVRGEVRVLDGVTFDAICGIATDGAWPAKEIVFPDSSRMAFKNRDKIHIYSTRSWAETTVIQAARNGSFSFQWSPDRSLIVIDGNGIIALCDGISGAYLGYRNACETSIAEFMPDGKTIGLRSCQYFTPDRDAIASGRSPFASGKVGAPPWSDFAAPRNLNECFAELDRRLNPLDKFRFKACSKEHLFQFGGGSFVSDSMICDVYDKWDITDIEKLYLAKGVADPRDVFGSVIEEYWLHLNSMPSLSWR